MLRVKNACENLSAHGLPRAATSDKPVYVRVAWLLLFLLFLCLFVRGLVGFVSKLQSRQVSSSLEASSVRFQFPDVYACFESPVSGTYAANMSVDTARELEARLNDTENFFFSCHRSSIPNTDSLTPQAIANIAMMFRSTLKFMSFYFPTSLPYRLLVDVLAHRAEQSVISSEIAFMNDLGVPTYESVNFSSFYHPNYLRCFRWRLAPSTQEKLLRSGTSAGLVLTLLLDGNSSSLVPVSGRTIATRVFKPNESSFSPYIQWHPVPLSDWSLSLHDWNRSDRSSGVRVFLTPRGEYPTDFSTSYLLAPGKFHAMDVSMLEQSRSKDAINCLESQPSVQFDNPYEETPYTHEYSYSYCYYYEYHKEFQARKNFSGPNSPLPWSLRNKAFILNMTGAGEVFCGTNNGTSSPVDQVETRFGEVALEACRGRDRCKLLQYDATISSADWPAPSSLSTYLGTTVAAARASAVGRDLSVPALDFLVSNASSADAAAYVRSNLLKLQIRPSRVQCDRLIYAVDYGLENFIADIGGILGIYLGMSLLTVCELIELIVDVARLGVGKGDSKNRQADRPRTARVEPESGTADDVAVSENNFGGKAA